MSERLRTPDVLRPITTNLRQIALMAGITMMAGTLSGCERIESGIGTFTCYTVGAEGGGINGPGHTTASGTKPIPGEVAAADLNAYYGDRIIDYNGDGRKTIAERNRTIRERPLIVHVPGLGMFRIEDTGGAFKNKGPGRFDLAMTRSDCNKFGKQQRQYDVISL